MQHSADDLVIFVLCNDTAIGKLVLQNTTTDFLKQSKDNSFQILQLNKFTFADGAVIINLILK